MLNLPNQPYTTALPGLGKLQREQRGEDRSENHSLSCEWADVALGAAGLSSPQTRFSTLRVEVVAKPTWKKPSCGFPSRETASLPGRKISGRGSMRRLTQFFPEKERFREGDIAHRPKDSEGVFAVT